ncbi:MAG: HAMP domain-containing histidine kinase, partial [Chitinophagaceae bacterium]
GSPQYDKDGNFTGYVGATVDITEHKSLQQSKDEFIGMASHELKTPVTSIKGYVQLVEQLLSDKGMLEEKEMLGRIDKQVVRLTKLIEDLLDVSKTESGKLKYSDAAFDFNEMAKEMLDDLQPTTNHLLQFIPGTNTMVLGDRERLGQVVTNLLSNAIKYSPGATTVEIETRLENNQAILSVKDFGIGISEKNLTKVFEQFYRVTDNKSFTFPGLGLGLFIANSIVKRHGGRMWVQSNPGEGSTFFMALPVSYRNTNSPAVSDKPLPLNN